jgi:serine/threonine protein kinase, bacterial
VPLVTQSYELTSQLGRGPTGTVWRARHRSTGERVAVKLLNADLATDPEVVARFIRERHLLTAALEPTVVPVRELLIGEAELALVTDLIPGPDLRERLDANSGLPATVAVWVALDIARALDSVHGAGLVHGELKPTNVLFAPPDGAVRLTDARIARLTRGYRDGPARFAEPAYAAPEVILGGPVVPPTDVYALGLLLYEMLTGEPLCAEGLSAHLRARPVVPFGLPAALRELIEECLGLDPERRPVPAAVAARLRRLDRSPGPAIPYPRTPGRANPVFEQPPAFEQPAPPQVQAEREAEPAFQPAPVRPAPPTAPPTTAPPSHAPVRSIRAHALAARARMRVILLAAGALVIVLLTVVILQSLPSATSEQGPTAGTAAPAPGTLSPIGAPPLTTDARAPTQAGAAAFVRYWFATITYAAASGDTGPFQLASGPGCQACTAVVQAIRSGWQDGRQMRGGAYTIRDVSADGFFTVEHPALTAVFDRAPRSTLAGGGTELGMLPAVTFATCRILLERDGGDWRVLSAQSDRPIG